AIEEEKLSRVKNAGIGQSGGVPYEAIGYCLEQSGIGIEEIDFVTYYLKPRRLLNRQLRLREQLDSMGSAGGDDYNAASVNEYHDRLKTLNLIKRLLGQRSKVMPVDHQLAHAASSFYLSGFDRAAVLILNGRGDYVSIAAGIGEGRKIRLLKRIEFPHSLGRVYSLVSEYLGFNPGGEHNTQWLSTTGEPEFLDAFREMIRLDAEGMPSIDTSFFAPLFRGPDPFTEKFYSRFGDSLRRKDSRFNDGAKPPSWTDLIKNLTGRAKSDLPVNSYRRNLAHSLQRRLEEVVLAMAESIRREYRADALCLAGGVALNSLLVSKIETESGYKRIFVQPASGNSGCSIGSALFQWHHQLDRGEPKPLDHVFLGPAFSDHEVKPELDNCKLAYRYLNTEEKLLDELVTLLERGSIVAWFQGRAEFGPRSLGARSILANPLLDYTKENLNLFVKHRETYRPFAASVPEERAGEFFERCSPLSKFLLTISRVREEKRSRMPAAWFAGGMARVHTVSRKTNPLFWQLLDHFGKRTGVPILVNTSFNLFEEPIVCTPRDAVRSFACSGIDALVINHFTIQK
ncbi:MAG: carbamoyltransferase family protein, partial [Blastocatellia bacterium]